MSENDYLLAWGAYLLAALGCLLVWFRLTRWLWRYLREPLRVVVMVLLFSPTVIDANQERFAPSIAIGAMDTLLGVGNNAWRAAADLSMYGLILFSLYLLFVVIRWPIENWWRSRHGTPAVTEDEPTMREIIAEQESDRYSRYSDSQGRVEPRL
ncbi:MFS transporter [Pseudomonas sp. 5P_3.1_Bac2]|uniref:MFS transporter n=1 Tax=Pseudomonas sp. 5P_3.1_Bac2 TaxID=2971617 RepID=UPI0021C6E673|nr:MFS transporter [Pseudomonas sp. 5P_3.1_Bac2]MCU1716270.1 MFS transporter [Pseudomonas sp. 5P_3.1_Bac2]